MSISIHGISTVAAQEFRVRIRAGRWRWLLGIWFAVLVAFTALVYAALSATDLGINRTGTPLFGILMLFVLGLLLLVVPSLTSQSVNGDRERGTLATMQVTLLSASEIAIGKLVAAWATALVFLGLSLPMVLWAMLAGGAPLIRVLATLGVVALLIGVICAICQGLSALFARSTTSSVISYLMIFALTVGTPIVFTIGTSLSGEERTTESYVDMYGNRTEPYSYRESRPDRVWWMLAPNPFVILADAAPALPLVPASWDPNEMVSPSGDVLGAIGNQVRSLRVPPSDTDFMPSGSGTYDPATGLSTATPSVDTGTVPEPEQKRPDAVWPWGLAFDFLLGLVFLLITIRKLQTPTKKLGRGVRVA